MPIKREQNQELAGMVDAGAGGLPPGSPPGSPAGGHYPDQPPLVRVRMERPERFRTADQPLWVRIREGTRRVSFEPYQLFIETLLCQGKAPESLKKLEDSRKELGLHIAGVGAYQLLKTATEAFLLLNCGVSPDERLERRYDIDEEERRLGERVEVEDLVDRLRTYLGAKVDELLVLPYFRRILEQSFAKGEDRVNSPFCEGILKSRFLAETSPCLIELIWSYWHEEAMLVQAINMVALRFQNLLNAGGRNSLANMNLEPLRPLSNLLWGYIQDEFNRLTVARRAYEYDHHYGITLYGKAVPALQSADSRSKFLEAFHHLLYRTSIFYKQDDDTTVIADGFPVLQALKEVHLLLAEGAHNQFGDLPWTARAEMLIQQWLMARPEMLAFLNGRPMVPYTEDWMPQVDIVKKLYGWNDAGVTHFHDLAVYGEQILLSVRYGDWVEVNDPQQATNWARYWRPEVQSYIHAYRAVTGVDLTVEPVNVVPPSVHLRNRLIARAPAGT